VSHRADCSPHPHFKAPLSKFLIWMICSVCDHSFREGFYTKEAFSIIFEKTHPNQKVGNDYERQRHIWGRAIERVIPHQRTGRWVDVGFGNGALLMTAAEYGYSPLGIDLRKDNVSDLISLGIPGEIVDFARANITPKASVVSMCDVLEHMQFPLEGIAAAHRNLLPGGVFLISMPNSDSPLWKLLDRSNQNPYWSEIEHFHNFSRRSIERILTDGGFTPFSYHLSERYRACMEIIAIKR
jgi:SAM-dependent methyltransferase